MIKALLNDWAVSLGMEFRTLKKRLHAAGVSVQARKHIEAKQIMIALCNDVDMAKARESSARASLLEQELAEKSGELVPLDIVQNFIRDSFAPVREQVIALPTLKAAECNPQNPAIARKVLEQWRDDFLSRCREHVPVKKP